MKDARGHGSNKRTSNADAANALMHALKSTQVPTHDAMVGQHVGNAFKSAAANGPEHESVGQSLRAAAALERDNAAAQRDKLGSKTGYEMSKRKYPITGRGEHGGVFRTRPRNK